MMTNIYNLFQRFQLDVIKKNRNGSGRKGIKKDKIQHLVNKVNRNINSIASVHLTF